MHTWVSFFEWLLELTIGNWERFLSDYVRTGFEREGTVKKNVSLPYALTVFRKVLS